MTVYLVLSTLHLVIVVVVVIVDPVFRRKVAGQANFPWNQLEPKTRQPPPRIFSFSPSLCPPFREFPRTSAGGKRRGTRSRFSESSEGLEQL